MSLFAKQNGRHRCRGQAYGHQRGGWGARGRADAHTLSALRVKEITNENLLQGMGTSPQRPGATWMGRTSEGKGSIRTRAADSLYCAAETNATWQFSHAWKKVSLIVLT